MRRRSGRPLKRVRRGGLPVSQVLTFPERTAPPSSPFFPPFFFFFFFFFLSSAMAAWSPFFFVGDHSSSRHAETQEAAVRRLVSATSADVSFQSSKGMSITTFTPLFTRPWRVENVSDIP
ncbi:hypothetical protein EYF80_057503 [Liparis tanakae]|uniref:Transmembrane protein n=1 Tax=Liparis tanakae TaxID=230148 RepID=A0A4Z2ETU9_9TELE|nr:hypothetical protein EYF80_057503 [Liparis tanakae]